MVSAHALEQISVRTGFKSATAKRFAENALIRGQAPECLPSKERKYLEKQEQKMGCIARLYNGCCFIFNEDGNCITAYIAPKWFGKKPYFVEKQRIRNYKKYSLHYDIPVNSRNIVVDEVMIHNQPKNITTVNP
jgi:hypothetical protein